MKILQGTKTVTGTGDVQIDETFEARFAGQPVVTLSILRFSTYNDPHATLALGIDEPKVNDDGSGFSTTAHLWPHEDAPGQNTLTLQWTAFGELAPPAAT